MDIELMEKREAAFWDSKNHKPHNCMIKGDTSTRINLAWFIKENGKYYLTKTGKNHYQIWLNNQYREQ